MFNNSREISQDILQDLMSELENILYHVLMNIIRLCDKYKTNYLYIPSTSLKCL